MKAKIILFVFGIIAIYNTQAQTYHPFPDSNAIWSNLSVYDSDQNYSRFGIIGDTNINSLLYHKIYSLHDSVLTKSGAIYFGALRENLRKVYFQYYNCQQETLLYDFTKEIGDTIYSLANEHTTGDCFPTTSFWSVITNIDSMIIDGSYRRVYHLSLGDAFWIEGIGSNYGLFNPIKPQVAGNYSWSLICFKQNEGVLYLNPDFNTCYPGFNGIHNYSNEIGVQPLIFPNPLTDFTFIELNSNYEQMKNIQIFNMQGQEVYYSEINGKQRCQLLKKDFKNGLFLIIIETTIGKIYNGKLIVE